MERDAFQGQRHSSGVSNGERNIGWGLLGVSSLASAYWDALNDIDGSTIVALASRDIDKCRSFIAEHQARDPMPTIPTAYGSYDALLSDPGIDAVYIPLPTSLRKDWVIKAAYAGKHVICEKPCAVSASDLRDMIAACEENNVQFMDGVVFMHSARLPSLEAILDNKESFGRLTRITSAVAFDVEHYYPRTDIRYRPDLEPHGAAGDVGWYAIRIALWAMQEKMPESVIAWMRYHEPSSTSGPQVIRELFGHMFFANGISASFYCSHASAPQQWAIIAGTKSYLDIPDVLGQVPLEQSATTFSLRDGFKGQAQEIARMLASFATQLRSGEMNPEWPRRSLRTQLVLDACIHSALENGIPVRVDESIHCLKKEMQDK